MPHNAREGSDFCAVHADEVSGDGVAATLLGAAIVHALFPGLGGVLLGGVSGAMARRVYKESQVGKKRVFVSFDFDHDRVLKDFIIGQARLPDSPFEVGLELGQPEAIARLSLALRRKGDPCRSEPTPSALLVREQSHSDRARLPKRVHRVRRPLSSATATC